MRLAFFSSIATDGQPTSGYEIANEALVDGLKGLGHTVIEFGFRLPRQSDDGFADQRVLDVVNFENSAATALQKLKWMAQAYLSGLPISAAKLPGSARNHLLSEVQQSGPFDGAIVNSYQMAAAFREILDMPYIYVAHNVEHQSALENAQRATGALERHLYRRDARLLKELEQAFCIGARYVWTFSEADLDEHGVKPERGCVLPLVAPNAGSKPKTRNYQFDLGLIGTWSWQPNFVGLKWFLNEIVPLLPASTRIGIAGGIPSGFSCEYENVNFLGRVDSATEFLDSAALVPLVSRGGTGVQLKTIEALQRGYTCVATTSSLRGIENLPANCAQADDAKNFAAEVRRLLELQASGAFSEIEGRDFYDDQRAKMLAGMVNGICTLT